MNFWVIVYRFAGVALGILLAVAVMVMFVPQYQQYRAFQAREAALLDEIRLEEEMLNTLRLKQERFRNEPRYVERIAHEVGLAKPDETIFRFVDDPPPASPP